MIDYDHSKNVHTAVGARTAMSVIFDDGMPQSLLDVGCGAGMWLAAAETLGITDFLGVDGIAVPSDQLKVSDSRIRQQDLQGSWDLGRRFDVALCLEVAEHLDAAYARTLIGALVSHSDRVVFSAACPGQSGQHHVNGQWPAYWQQLFNEHGFTCTDDIRWKIWDVQAIEPWYRQNMFMARRNLVLAGTEPRLRAVIHPAMIGYFEGAAVAEAAGRGAIGWRRLKARFHSLWPGSREGSP